MNSIPAKELKRRGVAAIESMINDGPVEIIKNNSPACVVLSVEQYRKLSSGKKAKSDIKKMKISELFSLPATGRRTRNEIDKSLNIERDGWDAK
jgi:hypothetical protein